MWWIPEGVLQQELLVETQWVTPSKYCSPSEQLKAACGKVFSICQQKMQKLQDKAGAHMFLW